MSAEQSHPLSRWIIFLKTVQILVAVIVLGLCAYDVGIMLFNGCLFAIYTSLFTLITIACHFYILRAEPDLCRSLAALVLEIFGAFAWLASCTTLSGVYALLLSFDNTLVIFEPQFSDWEHVETYCNGDGPCLQRLEFLARDTDETFGTILLAALGFSCFQVILYCISTSIAGVGICRGGSVALDTKHVRSVSAECREQGKAE